MEHLGLMIPDKLTSRGKLGKMEPFPNVGEAYSFLGEPLPVTIRDVAKKANVGVGTVSRVLNNSPNVKDSTRQRVLQAIDELNFRPSSIARRLSLGKTFTIAVVATLFSQPAIMERLRGIEMAIAKTEYDLILQNLDTPDRRKAIFSESALHERVDGILLISPPPTEKDLDRLEKTGIPFVIIEAIHPLHRQYSHIFVDHTEGSRRAVEHLHQLGHHRIGFISDSLESSNPYSATSQKFAGYKQGLQEAGLPLNPDLHLQGEPSRQGARAMARELLNGAQGPTAIFTASDTLATGVLEAARDLKLEVPEQLSVIGYDDIEYAEQLELTTVRQHLFASGKRGVEILLELVSNTQERPLNDQLPAELVVRGTTGPPTPTSA